MSYVDKIKGLNEQGVVEVFDIQDTKARELIENIGNGEDGFSPLIDVAQTGEGDVILTITDKEGTDTVTIPAGADGDNGQDGGYYTPSVDAGWLLWSASKGGMPAVMSANIRGPQGEQGEQGDKGDKGDTGTGFSISKTYSSVSAMNSGYATDGVPLYGFVLIDTGNVDDEDNAKLYVKGDSAYEYLTDLSGSQGIKGETGDKGDKGDTGVGIKSVVQTTTSSSDGGSNVITVTKTDNTTSTFTVKNGSKGSDGAKGDDGYTPVKGTDYFTEADKTEIKNEVLSDFGVNDAVIGTFDTDNNIIFQTNLADGTYVLKYKDTSGNYKEVGSIVVKNDTLP